MGSKRSRELEEQYEDAVLALLMNDYAEQVGNQLLKEYDEANAQGKIEDVPAELDAKCRKMIEQASEKSLQKERVVHFCRYAGRIAAAILIVLGVCATLVLSVEALRTPVLNFIIEQNEQYMSITANTGTQPTDNTSSTVNDTQNNTNISLLTDLLPDGFELVSSYTYDDGTFLYFYQSKNGATISFSTRQSSALTNTDIENATYKSTIIGLYEGLFIEKGDTLKVIWFDKQAQLSYCLRTEKMDDADFWMLVNALVASPQED